jgi:hypothetical protein
VDEDGRSDPNRNIYPVPDDDYVNLEERPMAEEEPMADSRTAQAKVQGSDSHGPSRSRGPGMNLWAVAGVILLAAIMISAGLITGLISLGNLEQRGSGRKN